jgi:RNA polymerase sigma factor (sigma-70 family)
VFVSQAVFSLSATSKPELLLAALLPDIRDAVSRACYHYSSDPSEIEDVCHQMIILLMEDDYRRLRSFHLESSIKTWLTAVALHYVSNYVGRQKKAISLDDISREACVCAGVQEAELISEEMRCELNAAVNQLTAREQQLLELLCRDDLSSADVAREMGIKVESVHRRKYALIKKLRGLVNSTSVGGWRRSKNK